MPELPELQALAEGLDRRARGRGNRGRPHPPPGRHPAAEPAPGGARRPRGRAASGGAARSSASQAEGDLTLVVHLMQAGRLGLAPRPEGGRSPRTAALDLDVGGGQVLRLRELSTHRRASAHLLDAAGLAAHRPLTRLGPEPIGLAPEGWREALSGDGAVLHTALRDGRRVAGIGRAYASDIMWAAKLAPFARAASLDDDQVARLARRPTPCSAGPGAGARAHHHRPAQQGAARDRRPRPLRRAVPALRHAPGAGLLRRVRARLLPRTARPAVASTGTGG